MMNDPSNNSILNSIKINNPLPTSGFSEWPDYSANSSLFNLTNVGKYMTLQSFLVCILVLILLYFGLSSLGVSLFPKKEENIFDSTQETSSNNSFVVIVIVLLLVSFIIGYFYYSESDFTSLFGIGGSPTLSPTSTLSPLTSRFSVGPSIGPTFLPTNIPVLSNLSNLLNKPASTTSPSSVTVPPTEDAYSEIADQSNPKNSTVQEITTKKQVFNIPDNSYNYENAKAVCAAYGSRLATYSEIEDAYKNGGEWCNYGWSDDQMALFPTQETTYNQYQQIEGHENDCGRPGINGGYMENPEMQFGVNCYGYKPKIKDQESYLMQYKSPFPQSKEELEAQQKVSFWKNKINDILVSPFNNTVWSEV